MYELHNIVEQLAPEWTSGNRTKLEAMLELAKTLLAIDGSALDTDPYLVSVANGTINLKSGALLPHRREEFISKYLDVPYEPEARAPRWEQFIDQVTLGDAELAKFLQRIAGYFFTGDISEQSMFILHGHGANGKSTFIEVLHTLFGPYATKTPMTTFLAPKGERASNDLARLRGIRLVSAVEARSKDEFNEPLIKEMTGGDRITARYLYKEYFEFHPQFKIVISVYDLPRIKAGDEAMNRRFVVVPFGATFGEKEQDKHLSDTLKGELPGILAWVVKGAVEWQSRGLEKPRAVQSATKTYLDYVDFLGAFIEECCLLGGDQRVTVREFHVAYEMWLKETHGLDGKSEFGLGRLMSKKGFKSLSRRGAREYHGIGLKTDRRWG